MHLGHLGHRRFHLTFLVWEDRHFWCSVDIHTDLLYTLKLDSETDLFGSGTRIILSTAV
jgi:hypothetical protein